MDIIRFVRETLSHCVRSHAVCYKSISGVHEWARVELPTRVIFIDKPENGDKIKVRLVETKGKMGQFIALSHRWGAVQPLQTTKANQSAHYERINEEHLPKTFRDAIFMAGRLGIEYLWIDSLCIVQDDTEDWLRESQCMGSIYQRALCTFAAVDSWANSRLDEGILPDSNMKSVRLVLNSTYQYNYNSQVAKDIAVEVLLKATDQILPTRSLESIESDASDEISEIVKEITLGGNPKSAVEAFLSEILQTIERFTFEQTLYIIKLVPRDVLQMAKLASGKALRISPADTNSDHSGYSRKLASAFITSKANSIDFQQKFNIVRKVTYLEEKQLTIWGQIFKIIEKTVARYLREVVQKITRDDISDIAEKTNLEQISRICTVSQNAWDNATVRLESIPTSFDVSVNASNWNSRAWVMQERVLSRRVFYFTKEQVFFECGDAIVNQQGINILTSELKLSPKFCLSRELRTRKSWVVFSKPEDPSFGGGFSSRFIEHEKYQEWWKLDEHYSGCGITYPSDRWMAISGLCQKISERTGICGFAGIWEDAIAAGILWHARDQPLEEFEGFSAPSWSWISKKGLIKYHYENIGSGWVSKVKSMILRPAVESLPPECGTNTAYLFGMLSIFCPRGTIWVSHLGFDDIDIPGLEMYDILKRLELEFQQDLDLALRMELVSSYRSLPTRTRLVKEPCGKLIGWVVMDSENEFQTELTVAAVTIRIFSKGSRTEQIVDFIVLSDDTSSPEHYRRIGRGRITKRDWIQECTMNRLSIL
jgi:Heterokaryon incompatibility protein (HET)